MSELEEIRYSLLQLESTLKDIIIVLNNCDKNSIRYRYAVEEVDKVIHLLAQYNLILV